MHPKERHPSATDTVPQSNESPRHPSGRFDPPTYAPYIPSSVEAGHKGRAFPVFTQVLCISAIFLEGTGHLCASIFEMDPIPSPVMLVLYILTVVTIGFNQWVLTSGQGSKGAAIRQSPRGLSLLIVSTVVSLVVALTAGYMFLPLAPVGGLLLLAMGLGMLLWTPYFAIISLILQLRQLVGAFRVMGAEKREVTRTASAAALAALALLFWQIGRPMIAANYISLAFQTEGAEQRRALNASRPFGGDTILLDIAYKRNPSYWACLGYNAPYHGWWPTGGYKVGSAFSLWEGSNWWGSQPSIEQARRLYFLLTGTPFELAPAPESFKNNPGTFLRGGPTDVAVEETGGMTVGRKIPGLSLAGSQMDWQMQDFSPSGTIYWTMKFKNDTDQPQEARADILIPDEAVVHKVSLWINGVEQQARFGHPDRVRQAYQEVAVVKRRDPLLVTMPAPGHVLAQCFPVPAKGEMQIRLGFTVPTDADKIAELPALGMVNFEVPDSIKGLNSSTGDLRFGSQLFIPAYTRRKEETVTKTLATPTNLYIVVDGSQGMTGVFNEERLKALDDALNLLPAGSQVRFFRTDRTDNTPVYWMPGQKLPNLFLTERREGGYDPELPLVRVLNQASLDESRPSAVLFLHGASPTGVSNLAALRQALQQNYWNGPALVGMHMISATPDALMRDLSGFPRVFTTRAFHESPDFAEQLKSAVCRAALVASRTSTEAETKARVTQIQADTIIQEALISPMKRVNVYADVLSAWRYANTLPTEKALDLRIAAGKAAALRQMVTPLSSAVVLESEDQYQRHGLEKDKVNDPREKANTNGTPKLKIMKPANQPEPGALTLFVVGGLAAFQLLRRKKVVRA